MVDRLTLGRTYMRRPQTFTYVTSMFKEGITIMKKGKPGEKKRRAKKAKKPVTKELGERIEGEIQVAKTKTLGTDDGIARKLAK